MLDGTRYTLTITMANPPSTSAPTAEAITCTNNTAVSGPPRVNHGRGQLHDERDHAYSTFVPIYHLLAVYTLQP